MNYNLHLTQNSSRPRALESQAADGGGAKAEPYMSVRSAHVRSGNPRTGYGPKGLAIPATVSKTPNVPPEAEDATNPGGGSGGDDETDPLRSFLFGIEDDPDANSDKKESENEDERLSTSSDDSDTPDDNADPFRDMNFGDVESADDQTDEYESEDESPMFLSDEEDTTEPEPRKGTQTNRGEMNLGRDTASV